MAQARRGDHLIPQLGPGFGHCPVLHHVRERAE
jgi:hypothetical protein